MMGVGKKKFLYGKVLLVKLWDQSARSGGTSCTFARVVPWWVLSLESLNGSPGFQLPTSGHKVRATLFQNGDTTLGCRLLPRQFQAVSEF